jgi:hypothetical protein
MGWAASFWHASQSPVVAGCWALVEARRRGVTRACMVLTERFRGEGGTWLTSSVRRISRPEGTVPAR